MNSVKLMSAALCAAACVTTAAFAEDDFGIESATPVTIADPVNPQPGMVLSGYGAKMPNGRNRSVWLKGSITELSKAPALKTIVDNGEEFSLKPLGNVAANAALWTGFMKCKRAGIYTFTLTQTERWTACGGYSVRINGRPVIAAGGKQMSEHVTLKTGFNKIELVCVLAKGASPLSIVYKPKESLSEARPLTPAMMFYDKKPEDIW